MCALVFVCQQQPDHMSQSGVGEAVGLDQILERLGGVSWDWWDWEVRVSYWRDYGAWKLGAGKAIRVHMGYQMWHLLTYTTW